MNRLLFALLLVPLLAFAQSYPAKPVRIIVPFPAGGTTDLVARMVQPKFQEFLGAQVIIDNKGGAGGSIGSNEAARAAPDGYTFLMVFDTHAINHFIYKDALDPFKNLEHLMLMVTSPSTLVAVPNFAPNSLKDLIAAAKKEPGKVTYASVGSASSNHLGILQLEQAAGIRMTHIPYRGGGPLIQALLGQQVDIAFVSTPLILPHLKSGKVKGIATGGKKRLAQMPEIPTLERNLSRHGNGLLVRPARARRRAEGHHRPRAPRHGPRHGSPGNPPAPDRRRLRRRRQLAGGVPQVRAA